MRTIQILILGLLLAGGLSAADAAAQFRSAMSSQDAQAKQQAINALASSRLDDEVVLPLLISAMGDRQAGRYALPALRSRTGLKPSPQRGGNTGYPGYPTDDTAAGWSSWLQARKAAAEQKKTVEDALATAEEAKQKAEEVEKKVVAVDLDGDGEISAAEEAASLKADADSDGILNADELAAAKAALTSTDPDAPLPDHLKPQQSSKYGKLDRLFFTDGSILRCYILTKRTDLQGNLTSVRIIHRDGGGEEIIDAAVVARVEEDID